MKFRRQRSGGASTGAAGDTLDTDSAFSDDASSMLSSSESSTSSVNGGRVHQVQNGGGPKKVLVDIYCADGSTKESILVDPQLTVGGALRIMAEKSCVELGPKWGLVERLPELCMERTLEDDEKLLRVVSCWKPQTSNRLIFSQRPEKYDLFRRPERYLLDPYDKATTEAVMQTPWDPIERQSLLQRCIDSVNEASSTQLEGPLWLKAEGKKSWKKFHFILRDGNLFQTTKSKKGSVHDVHCVASLATVRVFNGLGWKRKHKAPTDFCFALKPPEVQEKKAHIRYLCAENEFVKWGWYSMLRLTLGPPQQLVDNYNAQLGVPFPPMNNSAPSLSRSESITSNGDCSISSGCVSEVDEENGFDVDFPDGGTIKRKPPNQLTTAAAGNGNVQRLLPHGVVDDSNLPLPPPPLTQQEAIANEVLLTPTDGIGQHHMPLPPPPNELDSIPTDGGAVREEIYPCGVMRTRFPMGSTNIIASPDTDHLINNQVTPQMTQLNLLNQLPSQPPPDLQSLTTSNNLQQTPTNISVANNGVVNEKRKRKITFNEFVQSIEDCQWEPLKDPQDMEESNAAGANNSNFEDSNGCKEQIVSNWVLESLKHQTSSPPNSSSATTVAGATNTANNFQVSSSMLESNRPKLYNGRSVPNCFSPQEVEVQQRLAHQQDVMTVSTSGMTSSNRGQPPPAPPRRSNGTVLSQI